MADSILHHSGLVTFSSIDTLLTRFKMASQGHDISFSIYKKIVTVLIESLENVCKYTDAYEEFVKEREEFLPTLQISKNSQSIYLATTNPVRNEDVEMLRSKIEKVNNKDRDQLKELYLETITNGRFSEKGGAGLGFIEMAKTSGNDLSYSFEKVSEDYSMYNFKVTFTL